MSESRAHWKETLEKHFKNCNLDLLVLNERSEARNAVNRTIRGNTDFMIDVGRTKKGEKFVIFVDDHDRLKILSTRPETRHLVLGYKNNEGFIDRLLCGHDERQFFVASLPSAANVTTVEQAIDSLKSQPVEVAQKKGEKVRRQGEWYFVPDETFSPDEKLIRKDEPLVRRVHGRVAGKPHMAQFAVRHGVREVNVKTQHQIGKRLFTNKRRFSEVTSLYVKGRITHPDHKTLVLKTWHRVYMNREFEGSWNAGVAFLD